MAKYLHSLFVSRARTYAECTVKSRSALRMSVCACAFLVMQLNDVRVSPCNLYGWRVCAYAPYTTKYTSFVRLIFSSLILSFCSVSCYFVSIPYAVWAHDVVVVLGVFRLCYILDCCMSSSSSFFCLFRVFVSRESWSLPLLQSPTSPSSLSLLLQLLLLLLLLQLLLFTLMRTTDQNEANMNTRILTQWRPNTLHTFYFICRFIIISWFRHSTCRINFTDNGWGWAAGGN